MATRDKSRRSGFFALLRHLCVAVCLLSFCPALQPVYADTPQASASGVTPVGFGWKSASKTIKSRISTLQVEAKDLEQAFSEETASLGSESISTLGDRANSLAVDAASLTSQIKSFQTVYENFLEAIGASPTEGESPEITTQRSNIKAILAEIRSASVQSRLLELQGRQLGVSLQSRRSSQQSALLSQKVASPVTPGFWAGVVSEFGQLSKAFSPASEGHYPGSFHKSWLWLLGIIVTVAGASYAARYSFRFLPRFDNAFIGRIGYPPKAQSKPVFLSVMLAGIIGAVVASLIWQLLLASLFTGAGQRIIENISGVIPLAGFLVGAAPFFLNTILASAGEAPARISTYRRFVYVLAAIIIIQSFIYSFADENALPFYTRHLLEAAFAIGVGFYLVGLLRKIDSFRDAESLFFMPSLRGIAAAALIVALLAVLLGYMVFGFFVIAYLVSIGLGCAIILLIGLTLKELILWIFNPKAPLTRRLSVLGIGTRRVEQFAVVLNFVLNALLIILVLSIALSAGRFDIGFIADQLRGLFVGQSFHGFSLSLNTLVACIVTLAVAYYIIGYLKSWLDGKFFPLTRLDVGTRTSITNILTYVLWIAVLLLVMTEAGVAVQNLTWVVSALSVGIGFGLQSIVQNFVSGVILLAERPIRVGDLVEIGGVKGDVKKISVRATEITLGDGSTMIVPNSQFITSNVRNATMGSPISTTTANVTISTNADAAKAQKVLLDMMLQRTDILQDPAPSVSIALISETGITLAMSAKLLSVRDSGSVTNAMMLDAYSALRAKKIALGQPPAQYGASAASS